MREAIWTARFIEIMREGASVSRIAAFQFDRSCHRGGWMKSATPISAARAAMWRSVATWIGSRSAWKSIS